MITFASLTDCPDVMLGSGQWLCLRFSYTWDGMPRTRTITQILPMNWLLYDFVELRQGLLQQAHARLQLAGDPPVLHSLTADIQYGVPRE